MDGERREELERIMAGLAAGDRAMVLALHAAFGVDIRAALVALDRDGRLGVVAAAGPGDLDALVLDACFELEATAKGWDPAGGALPWVWAQARLRRVLVAAARFEQPVADERRLEVAAPSTPTATSEPDPWEVLGALAGRVPEAALLHEALERVVPPADRLLLLAHAEQVAEGDPAPAATVGALVGRSPAAVRKAVQRGRRRLADLASEEPPFRPLLGIPFLGPAAEAA